MGRCPVLRGVRSGWRRQPLRDRPFGPRGGMGWGALALRPCRRRCAGLCVSTSIAFSGMSVQECTCGVTFSCVLSFIRNSLFILHLKDFLFFFFP